MNIVSVLKFKKCYGTTTTTTKTSTTTTTTGKMSNVTI